MEVELPEASKNEFKNNNSVVIEEANIDEAITTEAKTSNQMEMFLRK